MTVDSKKEFEIWTSERSYRFKEEAIYNHAPQTQGIYSLVTFDEHGAGRTLFMDLVLDTTIFKALFEHWDGTRPPAVKDLLQKYPNLYFMFVVQSNAVGIEDQKDLLWALARQEKPELQDWNSLPNTGRYASIAVKDKSLL